MLLTGAALAMVGAVRRRHLTRPACITLLLVVTALLLAGSGLVHLPNLGELLRGAIATLGELTYAVVGAFAFAESGVFVGLVAPGELVVILGGVSAGHGTIGLPELVVVVWVCAFCGDLLSYGLGRRCGRDVLLRHGVAFGITEQRLVRVERFLAVHGAKTIIVGRFIGLVRALAPFVAGASGLPARRFVPAALVASGLWATVFCCLGYAFWESLDTLIGLVEQGSIVLVITAALVLAVLWRRRRAATT